MKGRNEGKWTYYSLDAEKIKQTKQFFNVITSAKENCICKKDAGCCEGCGQDE